MGIGQFNINAYYLFLNPYIYNLNSYIHVTLQRDASRSRIYLCFIPCNTIISESYGVTYRDLRRQAGTLRLQLDSFTWKLRSLDVTKVTV